MYLCFPLIFKTVLMCIIRLMTKNGELLLVTIDVESLYTNIDHAEGLEAVEYFLGDKSQRCGSESEFHKFHEYLYQWHKS